MFMGAPSTQWTDVVCLIDQTTATAWLWAVAQKVDLIRGAGRNWVWEGGEPIEPRVLGVASELLAPLAPLGLPVPRIAPVLGGGWQNPLHRLPFHKPS
jgi:hypothetical protein